MKLLAADGVKAIGPVWRTDAGSEGLANSTRALFTAQGGAVMGAVRYGTGATDFPSFVQAASDLVCSAIAQYGANTVAVYLAAFDEAVDVFHQAASEPVRWAVRWYAKRRNRASGGTALNSAGDGQSEDFDFWAIRRIEGRLAWVRTAHYESQPAGPDTLNRLGAS